MIQDEARAIDELFKEGTHRNLVRIFRHGWLYPHSDYYFIDMELCQCNLKSYVRPDGVLPEDYPQFFLPDKVTVDTKVMWRIARDIAAGLEFLHGLDKVHRDLKPVNGKIPQRV
jgi:serine/threonine protein kinase